MAKQLKSRAGLTKADLERILTARLALKEPRFFLEKVGNRLVGNIISVTFKGKKDHDRQAMIWDALEEELGPESVMRVGMLLAYTPDEWDLDSP
jgi:acid stress-induced BolA-like protein IbaG/YrbA